MNCGIYKITCLTTGQFYIGGSKDIAARWKSHRKNLRQQIHTKKIQRCYDEYGPEVFLFEIIENCSEDILDEREQFYLSKMWCKGILNTDRYVVGKNGIPIVETESYKNKYGSVKVKPKLKSQIESNEYYY